MAHVSTFSVVKVCQLIIYLTAYKATVFFVCFLVCVFFCLYSITVTQLSEEVWILSDVSNKMSILFIYKMVNGQHSLADSWKGRDIWFVTSTSTPPPMSHTQQLLKISKKQILVTSSVTNSEYIVKKPTCMLEMMFS